MADGVKFSIRGMDRTSMRFIALTDHFRKKVAQSALGSAVRVITNDAKRRALTIDDPETGRVIADNIVQRVRSRYYRKTGDIMISVGVNTAHGRIPSGNPDTGKGGSTPHWHLVEEGTEKMAARPYLRPAMNENIEKVLDTFARKLEQKIGQVEGL
jgi:HK97 gp10 family phage protein